ncbi:GntR family transcriptional regulator [Alloyangia pacifica]|uniref:GntR family transcriptional regulator n=1 Tax=Alloyangia pacifica TaxID=311180 RepID=UPI001CFD2940|nr:GntR family transcriptional regulator [Alloyangia pacifica]
MIAALEGIEPIARKETLGMIVREELRSALMAGRFQPGQKLTIRAVASALNVSLTPAREALYNLMAEGILESGANGTIFVPKLDEAQIVELTKIRVNLEGLAAREALPHLTDADIDALTEINAEVCKSDEDKDFSKLMSQNWRFHFGIYGRSDMPTLLRIIESCWLKMGSYLNVIYPDYGEIGTGLENHQQILKALRARDADRLCDTIRVDIEQSSGYLIEMIRSAK